MIWLIHQVYVRLSGFRYPQAMCNELVADSHATFVERPNYHSDPYLFDSPPRFVWAETLPGSSPEGGSPFFRSAMNCSIRQGTSHSSITDLSTPSLGAAVALGTSTRRVSPRLRSPLPALPVCLFRPGTPLGGMSFRLGSSSLLR